MSVFNISDVYAGQTAAILGAGFASETHRRHTRYYVLCARACLETLGTLAEYTPPVVRRKTCVRVGGREKERLKKEKK